MSSAACEEREAATPRSLNIVLAAPAEVLPCPMFAENRPECIPHCTSQTAPKPAVYQPMTQSQPTREGNQSMKKGQPGAFLVARMAWNLPVMRETQVRFLGQEDPVEKGMTTHSGILSWRSPWTEEPGLQPIGSQRVDAAEQLTLSLFTPRMRGTSHLGKQSRGGKSRIEE